LVMKKWQLTIIAVFLVGVAVAGPFYGSILNQQHTSEDALSVGSASAASTGNTIQVYLKIDDIDGDSISAQHSRTIELIDFNWTEAMPLTSSTSRTGTTTQWGEFSFTTLCGSASPKLFLACSQQKNIGSAALYVQKALGNGQTKDVITWSFQNVVVGSYSTSLRSSDGQVVDEFSIYFGKAQVKYCPVNADGSLGSPIETSYDMQSGRPG
jgi:type VI protein secretion system component Hcp